MCANECKKKKKERKPAAGVLSSTWDNLVATNVFFFPPLQEAKPFCAAAVCFFCNQHKFVKTKPCEAIEC